MSPEKFEKLNSEIVSEGIFNGLLSGLLGVQGS